MEMRGNLGGFVVADRLKMNEEMRWFEMVIKVVVGRACAWW